MNRNYNFLPFRFEKRHRNILLTNDVGDYHFLQQKEFDRFIKKELSKKSLVFQDLKSKHFLYDRFLPNIIDVLATEYRTKNKFLYDYTSLHMFVVTLRCNQKCEYCHASSQNQNSDQFDMDSGTVQRSVEFAFQTPSQHIKIEFQGGEPLLNFKAVKTIVEHAERINEIHKKHLEFVICTNLVGLQQEHLDYFKEKKIFISTSLDGPKKIHDQCRKLRNGSGSYDYVIPNIKWAQGELGQDFVTALLTVTPYNLNNLKAVIDEYFKRGLQYIFIRRLNPFGYAYKNKSLNYELKDFISSYKEALDYLISINLQGIFFPEAYATILLSRILTPFSTGFVDLQSPAGAGISCLIYDFNGDVFISDEARMLYHTTGDKKFCIGNVHSQNFHQALCSPKFKEIISSSCIDTHPGCAWCVYKPYCGADPVRNYISQGDMIGYKPSNETCLKHYSLFNIFFNYLELQSDDIQDVFWSWITNRSVRQIREYEDELAKE